MCDWNRSLAAYELGITPKGLRNTINEAKDLGLHIPMPKRNVMTLLPDERRKMIIAWVHKINMFEICRELKDDNNRKQGNDNQGGQ
jgi:trehalose-6-phosphate synthase